MKFTMAMLLPALMVAVLLFGLTMLTEDENIDMSTSPEALAGWPVESRSWYHEAIHSRLRAHQQALG